MLPMRKLRQASIVVMAILVGGCGGGEMASAPDGESSQSASAQSPSFLLLDKGDLPPGPVKAEALPEPCNPIEVLEEQDARVAGTPLYNLGSNYVGEAAGIAPSEKEAAAAVEELQAPERLSCIQSTIESAGPREGVDVTVGKPEPVAEGEEGSTVRFLEVDAQSKPVNATTVVFFRSGRCVATLLFLLRGGGSGKAFIDDLTSRAYGVLADADATCR
jgi:hypothetical protein